MRQQQNNFYPGNDGSLGGFYFLGAGTAGPDSARPERLRAEPATPRPTCSSTAPRFVSKGGVSGPAGMRSWRDAYFVQDDWKVTPDSDPQPWRPL